MNSTLEHIVSFAVVFFLIGGENMNPLELQEAHIDKGCIPTRRIVQGKDSQEFVLTETLDGVYQVITLVPKSDSRFLAGYAYVKWRLPDAFDIRDLAVTEDYRGNGLGSKLLHTIIQIAGKEGASRIWGGIVKKDLDNSPFLLEWYRNNGFIVEAPVNRAYSPMDIVHSVWLYLAEKSVCVGGQNA